MTRAAGVGRAIRQAGRPWQRRSFEKMRSHRKVERHLGQSRSVVAPHVCLNARLAVSDRFFEHLPDPPAARIARKVRHGGRSDQQHAGVIAADRAILLQTASQELGQRARREFEGCFDVSQRAATGRPAEAGCVVLKWGSTSVGPRWSFRRQRKSDRVDGISGWVRRRRAGLPPVPRRGPGSRSGWHLGRRRR